MHIDLAMLVLNGISALSSSLTLYRQYLQEGREISVEQIDSIIRPRLATESSARDFAFIISDDMLGNVLNNIKRAKDKLNESIRSNKSHGTRLRDADEVARDICFELNFIKRHNEGVLPDIESPNLYDILLEHGCNK